MDGQATVECCVTPLGGFLRFFNDIPDPRGCNAIHQFTDILVLAFCGVMCGSQGWVDVEMFGKSKLEWFKTFLTLPAGIPSHDTFGRVFAVINPDAFEKCFAAWMSSVVSLGGGKLIAIDGKSIRGSFERGWDKSGMTHLISGFVAANHMVFSQVAVKDTENEITAIPKLLELLDLSGSVVSIDAIGCQRKISQQIVDGKGDYLLAVKASQPALHTQVTKLLDELILESKSTPDKALAHSYARTVDGNHGRIETRRLWVTNQVQHIKLDSPWPGLGSIAVVESRRKLNGKTSLERRYYISSLKTADASAMLANIRSHWTVENNLPWQLDVSFREDEKRIRTGHAAENFSRLCRMTLNRLKADKTTRASIRTKRLKAAWDLYYLFKLLTT